MRPDPKAGSIRTTKNLSQVREDIRAEFRRWGMDLEDYEIMPRVGRAGARIDFSRNGKKQTISCSRSDAYEQNLFALWCVIEALRMAQQRGILDELVHAGLAMLPAGSADRDPYEILGVRPDAPMEIVRSAYRTLTKSAHPDVGGSDDRMKELNGALARIKAERGET